MNEELSYTNESGDSVHTSQYLRNRKSCCKTFCLHCPYGATLEKFGLKFEKVLNDLESLKKVNLIIKESEGIDTLGSSMIESAFGGKKQTKVSKYNNDKFFVIYLKDHVCGLARQKDNEIKEIFLKTHFKNQELDLPLIAKIYAEQ